MSVHDVILAFKTGTKSLERKTISISKLKINLKVSYECKLPNDTSALRLGHLEFIMQCPTLKTKKTYH